jgi:hypothetical protein
LGWLRVLTSDGRLFASVRGIVALRFVSAVSLMRDASTDALYLPDKSNQTATLLQAREPECLVSTAFRKYPRTVDHLQCVSYYQLD